MITDRDIEKAARYLLREHGEAAGVHAERHARDLRRNGFDDTAEAWERVARRLGADPPSSRTATRRPRRQGP